MVKEMKVPMKATCGICKELMVLVDTTDYDDTFHCEKCNHSVEVRVR